MCYYHPDISLNRQPISLELQKRAIRDAASELALSNLVFAGKEPLLNVQRLQELCSFAATLPNRHFQIGLVTNGRHVLKNIKVLEALVDGGVLNFVDVSIDSANRQQHDEIRGRSGTFELAVDALRRLSTDGRIRISSSSVLRADNSAGILALIQQYSQTWKNYFVTPIQPPIFSPSPPLKWELIHDFLTSLRSQLIGSRVSVEVMISVVGIYLHDAIQAGWLKIDQIHEDESGQIYAPVTAGNSRILLHIQLLPETAHRIARITYAGDYLPNSHFLQAARPEQFAIGNLNDTRLVELYRRSIQDDGVLAKLYSSRDNHDCRSQPCWSTCFGGISATEHSMVAGIPLHRRPHLCYKLNPDGA